LLTFRFQRAPVQVSIHGSEHSVFSSGQKRGRVIDIRIIIRYRYSRNRVYGFKAPKKPFAKYIGNAKKDWTPGIGPSTKGLRV
jgi:hypothetical protein